MPRRPLRVVVEGTDRYRRHPRLHGDVPAKVFICAVEAQRPEVRRDEIRAVRRQDLEADLAEGACQPVALALHVGGQSRVVAVAQSKACRGAPLQVGRRREGHELMRLGDGLQHVRRRRHVADFPAGHAKALAR